MPPLYRCPSSRRSDDQRFVTPYTVVTGPGTLWPESESARFGDAKDGLSRTLLAVEWADSDICWMEPRDLALPASSGPELLPWEVPSGHGYQTGYFQVEEGGGGNSAMADGSVHFLRGPLSAQGLAALSEHRDGKPGNEGVPDTYIDPTRVKRWVDWGHVVGFSLFCLTFLVLLWKAAFGPIEKKPAQTSAGA